MSLRSWRVWAQFRSAEALALEIKSRFPNARFSSSYLTKIERDPSVGSPAARQRIAHTLAQFGTPSCWLQLHNTEPGQPEMPVRPHRQRRSSTLRQNRGNDGNRTPRLTTSRRASKPARRGSSQL